MCTRAMLESKNPNNIDQKLFLTARNMDWSERFNTNLWAFPAGLSRNSMLENQGGFSWKTKYKTITACETFNDPSVDKIHKGSATDGMNEKGLVVNTLWLAESDYGIPEAGDKLISMGIWGQFMLDNYCDVKEAVKDWINNKYRIVTFAMPGSEHYDNIHKSATQHISISDPKGHSAIFEYYNKGSEEIKLHISTNIKEMSKINSEHASVEYYEDCSTMTNSPVYSEQKKLNYYWEWQWKNEEKLIVNSANRSAKTQTLPGTNRAPDRFSRISYYLNHIPTYNEYIGQAFSLMRTASIPIGFLPSPDEPNISNTLWSSVSDHSNKKYYFQSTDFPNLVWVDLNELDFNNNEQILELPINSAFTDGIIYSENVTKEMSRIKRDKGSFQFILG